MGPRAHDGPSDGAGESGDLGASLREEWRSAQDAARRDAVEQWMHERSLREAALEWLHRGDRVVAELCGVQFAGEVIDAGDDLLALRAERGRVDVHVYPSVPLVLRPERRSAGGARPTIGPRTFRAALLERESARSVVVGTVARAEPFVGRLVVGSDHAIVTGETEAFVPLWSIAYAHLPDDG